MKERSLAVLCAGCVVAQLGLIAVIARDRDVQRERAEAAEASVAAVARACDVNEQDGSAVCIPGTFETLRVAP